MAQTLEINVKTVAGTLAALATIWTATSSIAAFILIDPLVGWADERYDGKYASIEDVRGLEIRISCQYTEQRRDEFIAHKDQLPEDVHSDILSDYNDEIKKHTRRYDDWDCDDVLDSVPSHE